MKAGRIGSALTAPSPPWARPQPLSRSGLTTALFRTIGPRRTRLVAQIVAAVIGAAFVIGLQLAAIASSGTLSRYAVLVSDPLLAIAPNAGSPIWWPARAMLGDGIALAAVLGVSLLMLGVAIVMVAPRFADCVVAAAGTTSGRPLRAVAFFRTASPIATLRRKEWALLRRDPWLVSQTLMQMLYLLPPAFLLWRSFESGSTKWCCWCRCWSWRPGNSPAGSPGSPFPARTHRT